MEMPGLCLAYFGPETVLPMTSVVAAAVGVVMMFGRNTFRFALMFLRRAVRLVTGGAKRRGAPTSKATAQGRPNVRTRRESRTPAA